MSHPGYFSHAQSKGDKLGYYRASVACDHCRKRKARCMPSIGDEQGRCASCARLGRQCVAVKVEVMQALDTLGEDRTPEGIIRVQRLIGHIKCGPPLEGERQAKGFNPSRISKSQPSYGKIIPVSTASRSLQLSSRPQQLQRSSPSSRTPLWDFPTPQSGSDAIRSSLSDMQRPMPDDAIYTTTTEDICDTVQFTPTISLSTTTYDMVFDTQFNDDGCNIRPQPQQAFQPEYDFPLPTHVLSMDPSSCQSMPSTIKSSQQFLTTDIPWDPDYLPQTLNLDFSRSVYRQKTTEQGSAHTL